jgi:hypothetical protein
MQSQIGFPKELQNDIDMSVPASVSSYAVKVVPSNVASVVSSEQSLGAGAAASASYVQLNGTSSNVIFDIPAGQGKGKFIDPRFSTLNFRVKYEITNTPVQTVNTLAKLRSSGYAHWDRCYIQSQNGVVLDDVNLVGLVQDTLLQLEVDVAQRDALAAMYGFQYENSTTGYNTNSGHVIDGINNVSLSAPVSSYYSYSMPLLSSLIGKGARKMFQIGATSKLQLVLQSANIIPVTFCVGTSATPATFKLTIDNMSLNLQYVDIGDEGVKMLGKTGVQYYDGTTYRVSSATLPSTSGSVSLLSGLRGSSVRSLFMRCTESSTLSPAGCINYIYDSKMPQATAAAWNLNGMIVPSNPVDFIHNAAQVLSYTQEANGSFNTYEFKSGLVPSQYFIYAPGGTLATDADKWVSLATNASSITSQAQFLFGYNLEKISKFGLMDGQNLNSGNTFLNLTLANASTNTLTFFFIAKQDIIYVHNTETGELSARL